MRVEILKIYGNGPAHEARVGVRKRNSCISRETDRALPDCDRRRLWSTGDRPATCAITISAHSWQVAGTRRMITRCDNGAANRVRRCRSITEKPAVATIRGTKNRLKVVPWSAPGLLLPPWQQAWPF